ncbi:histidine-type phosphatase [Pseudoxanthomonas suwonensis]|uniref:histidine-type phosphatase n=1 Tax=Pseudoxanthomonas suwonensis TaxID=314722 RepID=UPI000464E807|nr:histidine-type phosphatase [Pseudoxanthomonas suwonensis]
MNEIHPLRGLLAAAIAAIAATLAACAGPATRAPQASAPAADGQALQLERVVMLMRHGVRPPTKARVAPDGVADQPWPSWTVGYGELTPHGFEAVKRLGQWDIVQWRQRGLLPRSGCPSPDAVEIAASAKSRTQDTARALAQGMWPECKVDIAFPATPEDDVQFHPLDVGAMPIDADEAYRAVLALAPPGGMKAELAARAPLFALLNHALGCTPGQACDISRMEPGIVRNEDDRPDVGDPFGLASTISQTFLLEYLEGKPMADVAWGRLTPEQIGELLEFHSIKFRYEGRAPYVAARAASPLASRMLTAMEQGPALTVLVGHDTNIADLGGFLDLHWTVPGYPRDDPPPGGALGFEVLADAQGQRFVRAFYRSQTMPQVRELQPLDAANPASLEYLPIPGCAEPCSLEQFGTLVRSRLVDPLPRKH